MLKILRISFEIRLEEALVEHSERFNKTNVQTLYEG